MLQVTKIFQFEMAHAIFGYAGACRQVHGHSYELQVTLFSKSADSAYLAAPGFIIDFKELKQMVNEGVVKQLDHKLVLSDAYLKAHPHFNASENLVRWQVEPSAENLLIFIRRTLEKQLPEATGIARLKLYETKNSFAEWVNDKMID